MRKSKIVDPDMPARAALRDLLWRVEHVRDLLLGNSGSVDAQTVQDLLDTSEARHAIGLGPQEPKTDGACWLPGDGRYAAKSNSEES